MKKTSLLSLNDQAVFGHVAVTVGVWVLGSHKQDVALPDYSATTPGRVLRTGLHLVAGDVAKEVAFAIAASRLVVFRSRSWLAATAEAQASRIERLQLHSFRFACLPVGGGAGPMPTDTGLTLRRCLSAATAARLFFSHVLNGSTLNWTVRLG